jgi:hypothetical protein
MQITKAAQQRLCFFNMHIDKFGKNFERVLYCSPRCKYKIFTPYLGIIKCVEKQNYTTEKVYHVMLYDDRC